MVEVQSKRREKYEKRKPKHGFRFPKGNSTGQPHEQVVQNRCVEARLFRLKRKSLIVRGIGGHPPIPTYGDPKWNLVPLYNNECDTQGQHSQNYLTKPHGADGSGDEGVEQHKFQRVNDAGRLRVHWCDQSGSR